MRWVTTIVGIYAGFGLPLAAGLTMISGIDFVVTHVLKIPHGRR